MAYFTFKRYVRTAEQTTIEAASLDEAKAKLGDEGQSVPDDRWDITEYEVKSIEFVVES